MLETHYLEDVESAYLYSVKDRLNIHKEATKAFCEGLEPIKTLENILKCLQRYLEVENIMASFLYKDTYNSPYFLVGRGVSENLRESEIFFSVEKKENIFNNLESYVQTCQSNDDIQLSTRISSILPRGIYSILSFRAMLNDGKVVALINLITRGADKYSKKDIAFLFSIEEIIKIFFINLYQYHTKVEQNRLLTQSNKLLQDKANSGKLPLDNLPGMARVFDQVKQVALLDSPVLILGETGVGKELVADILQANSNRSVEPYVKVNCGAMPDQLVDSELFGYDKGAFSGAVSNHIGRFERAHKGTLLLDEIGDLPLMMQTRLLRILQSGEMDRVGGSKTIHVDVRILAATNVNLHDKILTKEFREDLFYRLNVFPVFIPPLRERVEDIELLVKHYLNYFAQKFHTAMPIVPQAVLDQLLTSPWPGNVRELSNVLEKAFIMWMSRPDDYFTLGVPSPSKNISFKKEEDFSFPALDDVLIKHIKDALILSKGKINGKGGASELLNVNPCTLRSKMVKYKIPFGNKLH